MDELDLIRLFIDWGYTRLKVWVYDGEGKLLYEKSTFTSDLAEDPSFYSSEDIDRVCVLICIALRTCLPARRICIYTSSQMHALAGTLFPQWGFISTWNDLPSNGSTSNHVDVREGIPVLASMPITKITCSRDRYFLDSISSNHLIGKNSSITSLSSPLALVLNRIFHLIIPCSLSWWQSTCLAVNHPLIGGKDGCCYVSETPINIPSAHALEVLGIDSAISIYPEVGDLQASTYSSLIEADVLINLGTGSQVIFPSLSVSKTLPYFRYYNEKQKPIPTISHIPCGRLLADYVAAKAASFSALRETLNELKPSDLIRLRQRHKQTLLCFPGFSFHDCAYHQQPTTSIEELLALSAEEFLSIWILQYYRIIRNYIAHEPMETEEISINVIGDLGGLADGFVSLLVRMLPAGYQIRRRATLTLPKSLMRFHEA